MEHYIIYKLIRTNKDLIKLPISYPECYKINVQDAKHWLTYEQAYTRVQILGEEEYGVGLVLHINNPYFCIDLDHCVDENGKWSEIALHLTEQFKGAYIEISRSRRGIHIIGSISDKSLAHTCKNKTQGIELYTDKRFIALTGYDAEGSMDYACEDNFNHTVATYFSKKTREVPAPPQDSEEQCDLSDDEIIEKALNSKSCAHRFGGKASFKDLWERNVEALAQTYPSSTGKEFDESAADLALALNLAFWTQKRLQQTLRLMKRSELVREKWERAGYLNDTIGAAFSTCSKIRDSSPTVPRCEPTPETPKYLSVEAQQDYFKDCIYIASLNKIFTSAGNMYTKEQFSVMYAGKEFILDHENRKTTNNAWKAFTQSPNIITRRVEEIGFYPKEKPGAFLKIDGIRVFNSYIPINTPCVYGDVTPFLNLLKKLIPPDHDRQIFLAYYAGTLQFIGDKFKWCPFIQGMQGNGKTFLTRALRFCIGHKYSYLPGAHKITEKFNDWEENKLFIGVEDIYVPEQKFLLLEIMKGVITEEYREVEQKKMDRRYVHICHNLILNSNHKDAIKKIKGDRRFAPFFTPHQTPEDLLSDGLTYEYFNKLYHWAINGGFSNINYYLRNYKIPKEYGLPMLMGRAPLTSSTDEAITVSASRIEQEIIEAIDEGRPGFKDGWVSSFMLDKLLAEINQRKIHLTTRKQILESLGYAWHPALREGRATMVLQPDNMRPRLFIHKDSPHKNIKDAFNVCKAYIQSQSLKS